MFLHVTGRIMIYLPPAPATLAKGPRVSVDQFSVRSSGFLARGDERFAVKLLAEKTFSLRSHLFSYFLQEDDGRGPATSSEAGVKCLEELIERFNPKATLRLYEHQRRFIVSVDITVRGSAFCLRNRTCMVRGITKHREFGWTLNSEALGFTLPVRRELKVAILSQYAAPASRR